MRRGSRIARAAGAALVLGALLAPPARAQLLRLVPSRAYVTLASDGDWRATGGDVYRQTSFSERLTLPFEGRVGTGLLDYRLDLRPALSQHTSTGLPDALQAQSLDVLASARAFAARPLSLSASYARSDGRQIGGFGSGGAHRTYGFDASAAWRNPWLPVHAALARRATESTTRAGPELTPIRRDDLARTYRVAARNSKLDARLDWTHYDDRAHAAEVRTRDATVHHRLRWGRGSTLTSRYGHRQRAGTRAFRRSTWDETVRIQHADGVHSRLALRRSRSLASGADARTRAWRGGLSARVLPWLSAGADGSRTATESPGGRFSSWGAGPWAEATWAPRPRVRVSAGGSVMRVVRAATRDEGATRTVSQEPVRFDDARVLVLDAADVLAETIVLEREDGVVLAPGIDYEVLRVGRVVEMRLLPGGRAEAGETLLISYRVALEEAGEEDGVSWSLRLGARLGPLTLRHRAARRDVQTDVSDIGDTGFATQSTSARVSTRTPAGRLRLDLERRRRTGARLDYRVLEATAALTLPPLRRGQVYLDVAVRDVREDADRLGTLVLGAGARMPVARSLHADVRVRHQTWMRDGTATPLLEAGVGLDYRVGRSRLRAHYGLDRRTDGVMSLGHRVSLYATRAF